MYDLASYIDDHQIGVRCNSDIFNHTPSGPKELALLLGIGDLSLIRLKAYFYLWSPARGSQQRMIKESDITPKLHIRTIHTHSHTGTTCIQPPKNLPP
jgi:hypothetical protein